MLHGIEFDEVLEVLASVFEIVFESVESLVGLSPLLECCSFRCEVVGFVCSIERDNPMRLSRAACRSLRRRPGTINRAKHHDIVDHIR